MLPEAGAGSSPGVLMDVTPPLLCMAGIIEAPALLGWCVMGTSACISLVLRAARWYNMLEVGLWSWKHACCVQLTCLERSLQIYRQDASAEQRGPSLSPVARMQHVSSLVSSHQPHNTAQAPKSNAEPCLAPHTHHLEAHAAHGSAEVEQGHSQRGGHVGLKVRPVSGDGCWQAPAAV